MENVIEARGNSLQAEQGSAIVHCDRCACKMQLDKEEARGDDLHFCKRCEDCIDD